jgi:hypothetical protein
MALKIEGEAPIHDDYSLDMVNVFKDMTYVSMDMVTVSMTW